MSELSSSDSNDSLLNWRPVRRKKKQKITKSRKHKRKRSNSLIRQFNHNDEPRKKRAKLNVKQNSTESNERSNLSNKIKPKDKKSNSKTKADKTQVKSKLKSKSKSKFDAKTQSKSRPNKNGNKNTNAISNKINNTGQKIKIEKTKQIKKEKDKDKEKEKRKEKLKTKQKDKEKPMLETKENEKEKMKNTNNIGISSATQSVCCPICIVDLSRFTSIESDFHIKNCIKMYNKYKGINDNNSSHNSISDKNSKKNGRNNNRNKNSNNNNNKNKNKNKNKTKNKNMNKNTNDSCGEYSSESELDSDSNSDFSDSFSSEEKTDSDVETQVRNSQNNIQGQGQGPSLLQLLRERRLKRDKERKTKEAWNCILDRNKNKRGRKKGKKGKRKGGYWFGRETNYIPGYKRIFGTNIIVDSFNHRKINNNGNNNSSNRHKTLFFLSHFHSDHYIGITKQWNYGKIYCGEITARLVKDVFNVSDKYIVILPFNKRILLLDSNPLTFVTLLDANHCPGAAMFLFEISNHKGLTSMYSNNNNGNGSNDNVHVIVADNKPKQRLYNRDKNRLIHSFFQPAQKNCNVDKENDNNVNVNENGNNMNDKLQTENEIKEEELIKRIVHRDLHVGDFRACETMFEDVGITKVNNNNEDDNDNDNDDRNGSSVKKKNNGESSNANNIDKSAVDLNEDGGGDWVNINNQNWNVVSSLKPFVDNKIRHLHLDTTYCDPKYTFPKQLQMLGFVENVVCELYQRHGKRILFVIGTYFIGKEKVFLSIFKALKGTSKIYVTRHKQRIYGLLDLNVKLKLKSSKNNDDDDNNDNGDKVNINNNYNGNKHISISNSSKIFCTEPSVSQIFAVSMNNISNKYLKELLEINKKRFDFVVGFRATGWTAKPSKRKSGSNVMIVSVPYSEHSNFQELKWFVRKLQANKIIPTSNISHARKFVNRLKQF